MQNSLNKLIERAEKLAGKKVIRDFYISAEEQFDISRTLGVCLPSDFAKINTSISYIGFPTMEFSMVYTECNYIIEDNQYIRKQYTTQSNGKSDMSHILVLADDDGGSVFMITQDSPEKPTPIIWCDAGDMYWYSIDGKFPHPHDEWPSFADFFEYLVDQEEKNLNEDIE